MGKSYAKSVLNILLESYCQTKNSKPTKAKIIDNMQNIQGFKVHIMTYQTSLYNKQQ